MTQPNLVLIMTSLQLKHIAKSRGQIIQYTCGRHTWLLPSSFPLLISADRSSSGPVGVVDLQHDLPPVGQDEPPAAVVVVAGPGRPRGRRGRGGRAHRGRRGGGGRLLLSDDGGVAGDAALVVELLDLAEGIDVAVPAIKLTDEQAGRLNG